MPATHESVFPSCPPCPAFPLVARNLYFWGVESSSASSGGGRCPWRKAGTGTGKKNKQTATVDGSLQERAHCNVTQVPTRRSGVLWPVTTPQWVIL